MSSMVSFIGRMVRSASNGFGPGAGAYTSAGSVAFRRLGFGDGVRVRGGC